MLNMFRNRRKNNYKGTNRALQPTTSQTSSSVFDAPTQAVMYAAMMDNSNTSYNNDNSSSSYSGSSDSYGGSSSSSSYDSSSYSSDY